MKRNTLIILILLWTATYAQEKQIPEWFLNDLKANIGTWVADNKEYISENESYSHYVIEWGWGIGKTSIVGTLSALDSGENPTLAFWEFRQYWDNVRQVAVVEQFGNGGMIGIGTLRPINENTTESIQTFSLPDGRSWKDRHITIRKKSELITTSYKLDSDGNWVENRTYSWKKQD